MVSPHSRGRGRLSGCLVCGRFDRSRFCRGRSRLLISHEEGMELLSERLLTAAASAAAFAATAFSAAVAFRAAASAAF